MKARSQLSAPERQPTHPTTGLVTAAGTAISWLDNPTPPGESLPVVRMQGKPHCLTGSFRTLNSESQELFDELREAFRQEHAPATPTEMILVDRLAEHVWLSQRAQRMQDDAAYNGEEKWFAIMLRCQTTHDRAFHKCLAELRAVRKEPNCNHPPLSLDKSQQFESQNTVTIPPPAPEFESQTAAAVTPPPEREPNQPPPPSPTRPEMRKP